MEKQCWLYDYCNHVDCDKEFCSKKFKLDELFNLTLLNDVDKKEIKLRADEDGTDASEFLYLKDILDNIDKFVSRGDNLYLHSLGCGNGKSTTGKKAIKAYLRKIWYKSDIKCRALFIHVPRLLLEMKQNITRKSEYAQYVMDNAFDADLVVFDEVATKELSNFEFEHILNIINTRLEAGKANIFTSNVTNEEFLEKMGSRLYSRIINNSLNVELHGMDKRGLFRE